MKDECDPLAALLAGDPQPFEDFVRRELRTFLGFFIRLGAGRGEAEDLTQELFLKLYQQSLYQQGQTYRPQGRFRAYAFRVARNLWVDRRRRTALRRDTVGEGLPGAGEDSAGGVLARTPDPAASDPALELDRREEVARLRAALAELGEHHRIVFELGVIQGLPYQEIAGVLGIPVGTVKSRMFHAVRRLQMLLEVEE